MLIGGTDIVLFGAAFVAALVSGLAGFAFALVAAGAFLQFLPPTTAVPIVLAGSAVAQLYSVFALRRAIVWPRLAPFVVGGLVGLPIGIYLLTTIEPSGFRLVVGLFLVSYSAWALIAPAPAPITTGGALADGCIGAVGGVLGGLAALSGAIPTIWCGLRGWTRDEARAVYQPYILVMQIVALAMAAAAGAIDRAAIGGFAVALPAVLIGAALGMRLYRHVNDRQFRLIVLWLLLASGAALLAPRLWAAAI